MSEIETLKTYLANQSDSPRLHINGSDHPTALITVDFGQPLSGVSMNHDRFSELSGLMKAAAKTLLKRRGQVRVNYDNHHGVVWAALAN